MNYCSVVYTLADVVKNGRKALGWSQSDLARSAGVSVRYVSSVENGQNVTMDVARRIANALGITEIPLGGDIVARNTKGQESGMLVDLLDKADPDDVRQIVAAVRWVLKRIDINESEKSEKLSSRVVVPPASETVEAIGVTLPPASEWIERDFDYPRDMHVWVVPEYEVAAGSPINPDVIMSEAQVLNSLREVRSGRFQVIRVVGESMAPVLRNGWKVTVDTWGRSPSNGDIVACYLRHEGSTLGVWEKTADGLLLRKENPDYEPVELGDAGEWLLLGCVKNIVDAPVVRKRHLSGVQKKD